MKFLFNPGRVLNLALLLASWLLVSQTSLAVELLISGDFETPGGVGDIPGWTLDTFVSGTGAPIASASLTGGEDVQLFLQPYVPGGPRRPDRGNFNDDGLPAGSVGGDDYLIWARNNGLTGTALPEQGDANGDTNVDDIDLDTWQRNFGTKSVLTNARLVQVVPAAGTETYSFVGTSTFEDNYSGLADTLDAESPFGAITSPTETTFKMEFLNSGGAVIGAATPLDLRSEQQTLGFPGFPLIHTPLVAQAPAGTTNVRVTAEATDMAWNGNTATMGNAQSAFFNDFSLKAASEPEKELLTNGDLNLGTPDALDFWELSTVPDASINDEILRTPIAPWANHTPGGTRGVWLSAFFGAHPNFEPDPVDGVMSQTKTAVAGGTYSFSGWTKFEANYSGGVDTISGSSSGDYAGLESPTKTEIKLEFLDLGGTVLDSAVIDVEADRLLQSPTNNPNDNQWYEHTLAATAPAGTIFARLTGQMLQGVFNTDVGGGQSAFFDDFSLDGPAASAGISSVPEPAALVSLVVGGLLLGTRRPRRLGTAI